MLLSFLTLLLASAQILYKGVNECGAEFGTDGNNDLVPYPGVYGTQYIYPEPRGSTAHFFSKGMNTIRLPFRWERLQPVLGANFNGSEKARLIAAVNSVSAQGGYVLIDPHNYGRYNGSIIGQSVVSAGDFADFWKRLATMFGSNSKVLFGLMNEPHDQDPVIWANTCNLAIASIRSTGAKNLITVPGIRWTGAWSWGVSDSYPSNAVAMSKIVDSGNNFVYELHEYFDSDYSGGGSVCAPAPAPSQAIAGVTNWLRTNGHKGFMAEFGTPNNPDCLSAMDDLLSYMENNSDVWIGFCAWAAGPWWGSYPLSLEPTSSGQDTPQFTQVLSKYLNNPTSPNYECTLCQWINV